MKRLLVVLAVLGLAACGDDNPSGPSSLEVTDVVIGTGATAVVGDTLNVHYILSLTNGTKIQSSYDTGTPFPFRLGSGQVIAGWDQGLPGIKVGGKRHLVIPPSLAYGNNPPPGIPSNATLVFDVELLSIAGK